MEQYLLKGAEELNIALSVEQVKKFVAFYNILISGNKVCNLTAITEMYEVVTKHFLDSLSCVKAASFEGNLNLLDVGTGAGFPGIPIKILYPDLSVVLIEASQKKVDFLNNAVSELALKKVKVIHIRAEEVGVLPEYREKFDRVTARAVAQLNILSEYCIPMVKMGGFFIALKGPSTEVEVKNAIPAIKKLGGEIKKSVLLKLPLSGEGRTLITIRKVLKTPKGYPRRIGIPTKNPLS